MGKIKENMIEVLNSEIIITSIFDYHLKEFSYDDIFIKYFI